ncbi:glycoside hydrolase superfamily [Mrakia frigida]|uniref:glycoside hydrolase superfamily n=1 Tax=Mrakia frigida TaxID=29902 RepID=UPI003FCBF4AB
MPPPPSLSPVTNEPVGPEYIHSSSAFFRDTSGRHLLLRGVNLSGASKSPLSQPSYLLDDFWESAERGGESFVGQPLRLDDGSADVHLARLRGWGFNMLRYVVTWEALEREGPGIYDEEFMDYTVEVLKKCKEYGFKVFMDPHQDIWSRFSGGSGAPYWTLAACGLNPRNFTPTQAAYIHCEYPSADDPDPASYPAMIWSTNYQRLISQTIFTLFYGGRDFAPRCIIDGVNIQEYLQTHFNQAMYLLAVKIREAGGLLEECVIGWDSMNEPSEGLIGYTDIGSIPKTQALKKGPSPTAFEGMRLGMGQAVTVENWTFSAMGPTRAGSVTIDPKGLKCWMDPSAEANGSKWGWKRDPGWTLGTCIWALHGVWDPFTSNLLLPSYFSASPLLPSSPISFVPDYWRPAWVLWARKIRKAHPECIHFIQPPVFHQPPVLDEADLAGRACVSCHYYDGLTLLTRHWNWFNADALGILRGKYSTILQGLRIGEPAIRKCLREQLGVLKQDTFDVLGQYPTLIGEIGIPYDMDEKKAYGYVDDGKGKGDYSSQQKALDASLNACDGENILNYTIWTYCVDNCHQWGDNWCLEDLSLWSADDTKAANEKYANEQGSISESDGDRPNGSRFGTVSRTPYANSSSLAPSALSLNTISALLPRPSSTTESVASEVNQPDPLSFKATMFSSEKGISLPDDVLTDGSRAVGAFARPFPIATVGVPFSLDFEIKSSVFKMSVEMYPDDEATLDAPTEIFLPWIHYGSAKGLPSDSTRKTNGESSEEFNPRATSGDSDTTAVHPSPPSSISKAKRDEIETTIVDPAPSSPSTTTTTSTAISPKPTPTSPTAKLPPFEIDVDVVVSTGRYEIDGQILRWWYSPPTVPRLSADLAGGFARPPSSDEPKPSIYTIQVKRRGGPIKSTVASGGKESGFWEVCSKFFG